MPLFSATSLWALRSYSHKVEYLKEGCITSLQVWGCERNVRIEAPSCEPPTHCQYFDTWPNAKGLHTIWAPNLKHAEKRPEAQQSLGRPSLSVPETALDKSLAHGCLFKGIWARSRRGQAEVLTGCSIRPHRPTSQPTCMDIFIYSTRSAPKRRIPQLKSQGGSLAPSCESSKACEAVRSPQEAYINPLHCHTQLTFPLDEARHVVYQEDSPWLAVR